MDLQQKYLEMQILEQHGKEVQQQLSLLDQQFSELKRLGENLNEIEGIKEDTEIFVPLGAGFFIRSVLKDNSNVLMNIGASTLTIKSISSSKDIISKQLTVYEDTIRQMRSELSGILGQIRLLNVELEALTKSSSVR